MPHSKTHMECGIRWSPEVRADVVRRMENGETLASIANQRARVLARPLRLDLDAHRLMHETGQLVDAPDAGEGSRTRPKPSRAAARASIWRLVNVAGWSTASGEVEQLHRHRYPPSMYEAS